MKCVCGLHSELVKAWMYIYIYEYVDTAREVSIGHICIHDSKICVVCLDYKLPDCKPKANFKASMFKKNNTHFTVEKMKGT